MSAVLLETGIFCSDFHSRDHWPYCCCSRFLAALTTRVRSSVLLDPRAHTFLISPIQSATEEMAAPAPATALFVRSVLSALSIPLHGGKFIRCDASGKAELPSFFIFEIVKKSVCTKRTTKCVPPARSR